MSDLEEVFDFQLRASGFKDFVREYKAIPRRKYLFDFAFPEDKLLIEIQGGVWSGGAHGRPVGIVRDYEKTNLAAKAGYHVLQFDTKMVMNGKAIEFTEETLKERRSKKRCTKKQQS